VNFQRAPSWEPKEFGTRKTLKLTGKTPAKASGQSQGDKKKLAREVRFSCQLAKAEASTCAPLGGNTILYVLAPNCQF